MKINSKRAKWKQLLAAKEKEIVEDYNKGILRNQILRKYNIPEGQLYSIIRKRSSGK